MPLALTSPTFAELSNLVGTANIVVRALPNEYNQTDEVPFGHYVADFLTQDFGGRDENSEQYFWVIRMLGAYEATSAFDYDPDGEVPNYVGYAPPTNTTYVFCETTRDVREHLTATEPFVVDLDTALDRVSAHEALHRFFGGHGTPVADAGIMQNARVVFTTPNFSLTGPQIRAVQRLRHPK